MLKQARPGEAGPNAPFFPSLSSADGESTDNLMANMKAVAARCPSNAEFSAQCAGTEAELERVTASVADMGAQLQTFDEQVAATVAAENAVLDKKTEGLRSTVKSLEASAKRMREQIGLQAEFQQESDSQQLIQNQIDATKVDLERSVQLFREVKERADKAQAAQRAARAAAASAVTPVKSERKSRRTPGPRQRVDAEEATLQKQCVEMQQKVSAMNKTMQTEREQLAKSIDEMEEEYKAAQRAKADAVATPDAAGSQQANAVVPAGDQKESTPLDPFMANIRSQLMAMLETKADQKVPVAVAMKLVLDNNGRVAQKQLKKDLAARLDNSSRVTQTIYSLIGLRLVKMDRSNPKNVCVVSCM